MMIFEKDHGYPMTLIMETVDSTYLDESWEGYVTTVFDEDHVKISEFYHNTLHDRALWAKGFYVGLEIKKTE